jgi:hypothetical protein
MTAKEIKKEIERLEIDRKALAEKIGCAYGYLNSMINGFNPMKQKWHDRIVIELEKHK